MRSSFPKCHANLAWGSLPRSLFSCHGVLGDPLVFTVPETGVGGVATALQGSVLGRPLLIPPAPQSGNSSCPKPGDSVSSSQGGRGRGPRHPRGPTARALFP